ncbi:mucin-2 isoform X2 [Trematomus bernacchii]|uniref:mucin-2 isoform X2 n=1 Tax=Trematomus bernacchii TaxID=40690 RepID=UPI00146E45E3|nr:mucin-2 isoform X2 [Trematomus bernacchii]
MVSKEPNHVLTGQTNGKSTTLADKLPGTMTVRSVLLNRDSPDIESRLKRRRNRTHQVRFKDLEDGSSSSGNSGTGEHNSHPRPDCDSPHPLRKHRSPKPWMDRDGPRTLPEQTSVVGVVRGDMASTIEVVAAFLARAPPHPLTPGPTRRCWAPPQPNFLTLPMTRRTNASTSTAIAIQTSPCLKKSSHTRSQSLGDSRGMDGDDEHDSQDEYLAHNHVSASKDHNGPAGDYTAVERRSKPSRTDFKSAVSVVKNSRHSCPPSVLHNVDAFHCSMVASRDGSKRQGSSTPAAIRRRKRFNRTTSDPGKEVHHCTTPTQTESPRKSPSNNKLCTTQVQTESPSPPQDSKFCTAQSQTESQTKTPPVIEKQCTIRTAHSEPCTTQIQTDSLPNHEPCTIQTQTCSPCASAPPTVSLSSMQNQSESPVSPHPTTQITIVPYCTSPSPVKTPEHCVKPPCSTAPPPIALSIPCSTSSPTVLQHPIPYYTVVSPPSTPNVAVVCSSPPSNAPSCITQNCTSPIPNIVSPSPLTCSTPTRSVTPNITPWDPVRPQTPATKVTHQLHNASNATPPTNAPSCITQNCTSPILTTVLSAPLTCSTPTPTLTPNITPWDPIRPQTPSTKVTRQLLNASNATPPTNAPSCITQDCTSPIPTIAPPVPLTSSTPTPTVTPCDPIRPQTPSTKVTHQLHNDLNATAPTNATLSITQNCTSPIPNIAPPVPLTCSTPTPTLTPNINPCDPIRPQTPPTNVTNQLHNASTGPANATSCITQDCTSPIPNILSFSPLTCSTPTPTLTPNITPCDPIRPQTPATKVTPQLHNALNATPPTNAPSCITQNCTFPIPTIAPPVPLTCSTPTPTVTPCDPIRPQTPATNVTNQLHNASTGPANATSCISQNGTSPILNIAPPLTCSTPTLIPNITPCDTMRPPTQNALNATPPTHQLPLNASPTANATPCTFVTQTAMSCTSITYYSTTNSVSPHAPHQTTPSYATLIQTVSHCNIPLQNASLTGITPYSSPVPKLRSCTSPPLVNTSNLPNATPTKAVPLYSSTFRAAPPYTPPAQAQDKRGIRLPPPPPPPPPPYTPRKTGNDPPCATATRTPMLRTDSKAGKKDKEVEKEKREDVKRSDTPKLCGRSSSLRHRAQTPPVAVMKGEKPCSSSSSSSSPAKACFKSSCLSSAQAQLGVLHKMLCSGPNARPGTPNRALPQNCSGGRGCSAAGGRPTAGPLTSTQAETLRQVQEILGGLVSGARCKLDPAKVAEKLLGPNGPLHDIRSLQTQLQSLEGVLETSQNTIKVLLDVIQDLEKKEAERDGHSYHTGQDIENCGTCRDCACIIYSVEHDFRLQEGQVVRTWKVGDPPEGSPQTPTPQPSTPQQLDSPQAERPPATTKKNRKKCFWFL